MRRGQDDAVGLDRGDRTEQFAGDMVAMRVDQFDEQPIAMLAQVSMPPSSIWSTQSVPRDCASPQWSARDR